jgi:uncharacterized membrane protein
MNRKNDFLETLEYLLSRVPESERQEMLYDYQEHFEIGLANGKSQEELTAELGDPYVIARDLLADYQIVRAEKDKTPRNMARAIGATIGLSFFNLIFILGPVAGLFGAYIALCAVSFGLTVLPLAILGSYFFGYSYESFLVNFFVSLTSFSLGMLMSIGMIYVGKFFYSVVLRYINFNVKTIKGERAA